jgi:hypothetical protein
VTSGPDDTGRADVSAERAGLVLGAAGVRAIDSRMLAEASRLVSTVRPVRRTPPLEWAVRYESVRAVSTSGRVSLYDLVCSCQGVGRRMCPHRIAAVLWSLREHPDYAPIFAMPEWELRLRGLTEGAAEAALAGGTADAGWIRYHLDRVQADGQPRLAVRRELIRLSPRDGRELKPLKMPERIEDAAAKVQGVTDADRRVHERLERATAIHTELGKRFGARASTLGELVDRLLAEALVELAGAKDVWLDGRPVQVVAEPLAPALVARDREDGDVELAVEPEIVELFDLAQGFALASDRVLRPLAAGTDPRIRALAGQPPVIIPAGEVERFVERICSRSAVPIRLRSARIDRAVDEAQLEGRVVLSEADERLRVELDLVYRTRDGGLAWVGAADADAPLPVQGRTGALVRRDPELEARLLERFAAVMGASAPLELDFDEAVTTLLDRVPALEPPFVVYGAGELVGYRVVGQATPSVSVGTGIDWFDLGVRFEVGGESVSEGAVLRSWLARRRVVRLASGALARLPETWLAKHGRALDELRSIREASGGRPGVFAALVAQDVLRELDPDAAVQRWRKLAGDIRGEGSAPDRPVPPGLLAELRDYQRDGFRWLCWLRDLGLGGCLADDMGLGKTVQALALLVDSHAEPGAPSLVVAPTSAVGVWQDEAARWAPGLRVAVHHGASRGGRADLERADVVVTSYALLRLDSALLASVAWRVVILDEAQHIKNPKSQVARAARALRAGHRFALTGTPIENNLFELWSLFQFLLPGFFGAQASFARRYGTPIHRHGDERAMADLRRRIRPFMLRRLKREVAQELPPLVTQVVRCALGPAQRALYEQVRASYRRSVMEKVEIDGRERHALHVLEALMRLRQACCDPRLLPFPEAARCGESAKLDVALELAREACAGGHRALVFSQWPSLLQLVRQATDAEGMESLYLDGATQGRQALVARWNAPDGPPLFFISLKAGGTALTLTGADVVIHLDPWWNPAAMAQATDRAHRIGQERPVTAYQIIAEDTVEERVLELVLGKAELASAAVDLDRVMVGELGLADLAAVFGEGEVAPGLARPPSEPVEPHHE